MKVVNLDAIKTKGEITTQSVQKYLVYNNFLNILFSLLTAITVFSIVVVFSYFVVALISFVLALFLFIGLLIITLATLGIVYLTTDIGKAWGWFDPLMERTQAFYQVLDKIYHVLPYLDIACIALCVVSIVLFAKNKLCISKTKIVWLSIFLVVLVACAIFAFLSQGGSK